MNVDWLYGVFRPGFWGYFVITFLMVQVTMMAVTLYLHRDAAHRSVDLHPALRHFFRFWTWATSGMITREWVAVHRKHHAFADREGDPHSPNLWGLKKILLEGAEVYRISARNPEIAETYGRGTPDDWLERNVYARNRNLGIIIYVVSMLVLFGAPGIIMLSVQLVSMPLFAAGVINGVAHAIGYRNFDSSDTSRNVVPWGLLVGGEELHNNHHAFPSSARFALARHEIDIGWVMLNILSFLGLAKIRSVAEKLPRVGTARSVDVDLVKTVVTLRLHVMREYTRRVSLPVLAAAMQQRAERLTRRVRKLFVQPPHLLDEAAKAQLSTLVEQHAPMKAVEDFRDRLAQLWSGAHHNNEQLVQHLKSWCSEAEASGIRALEDFARMLRGYELRLARA